MPRYPSKYLVGLLSESLDTVDPQSTIIHHSNNVAALRTNGCRGDWVIVGPKVKKGLACLDVDETHDAILTQHT